MTLNEIETLIEEAIPGCQAYVLDPMSDGQHLQAFVISSSFEGMPVFKQHQLVMHALKDLFNTVHAMGLKTFTPTKWNEVKSQYGFEV
jgi:acid stress-induced BolA-like protein IbaG/YrbA